MFKIKFVEGKIYILKKKYLRDVNYYIVCGVSGDCRFCVNIYLVV